MASHTTGPGDLGTTLEKPTPAETTSVFGTLLFLASDIMLFAGFFAAYFLLRGQTTDWPPPDVDLEVLAAAVGMVVLLLSSVTMHMATTAYGRGEGQRAQPWLLATAALGAAFVILQLRDYATVDFQPEDHAYGGVYWLMTGLHVAHVLTGIFLISLLSWRIARNIAGYASVQSTAYFWHMVDAIWVFLFVVIWVIQ